MSPEMAATFDEYCLKVATAMGKVPFGLRTTIGRLALEEWLKKHGTDTSIAIKAIEAEAKAKTE